MQKIGRRKVLWIIVGAFIFITYFIWRVLYIAQDDNTLTVAFLDIGQGDSIFVESPSGVQVLIDGGSSGPRVLRELGKVMPFYDRTIDIVMATHPDTDHVGGLIGVLKRYKVSRILRPGVAHDAPAIDSLLLEIAKEKNGGAIDALVRRGQVYDLGVGRDGNRVELHILFPDRDISGVESNLASIVARLTYGETSALLTGDSPKAIEKYLVSLDGTELKSDILKLGHHGSKTSTTESFLGYVDPTWAVVSAGEGNKYGHPHKSVIDKVERFEIAPLSTAKRGTIIFESDGSNWSLQ